MVTILHGDLSSVRAEKVGVSSSLPEMHRLHILRLRGIMSCTTFITCTVITAATATELSLHVATCEWYRLENISDANIPSLGQRITSLIIIPSLHEWANCIQCDTQNVYLLASTMRAAKTILPTATVMTLWSDTTTADSMLLSVSTTKTNWSCW